MTAGERTQINCRAGDSSLSHVFDVEPPAMSPSVSYPCGGRRTRRRWVASRTLVLRNLLRRHEAPPAVKSLRYISSPNTNRGSKKIAATAPLADRGWNASCHVLCLFI